jgi:hypothetical protein
MLRWRLLSLAARDIDIHRPKKTCGNAGNRCLPVVAAGADRWDVWYVRIAAKLPLIGPPLQADLFDAVTFTATGPWPKLDLHQARPNVHDMVWMGS